MSWKKFRHVGPGLAIAATGVGASDMVASATAGAKFGFIIFWAVLFGAVLKYFLTEGLARWQLASGETLIEAWICRFPSWVKYYFGVYLIFWTVLVGAALLSACGLAAHALFGFFNEKTWAIIHSLFSIGLVVFGNYQSFEKLMKLFIGILVFSIVGSAMWTFLHETTPLFANGIPPIPMGGENFILGVIGGVGGTLTLLSYSYWIQERNWHGAEHIEKIRFDLKVAYYLAAAFGVGIMYLAAMALHPNGILIEGNQGLLKMAGILSSRMGVAGEWLFIIGFWAAVATSTLGVWQSVPYMFADYLRLMKGVDRQATSSIQDLTKSKPYRNYLYFIALAPIPLLYFDKPFAIIYVYLLVGALFMPAIALSLLYLNNKENWVGKLKNNLISNGALVLSLILFSYLAVISVLKGFS